jgi:hypothetical protein
VAKRGRLKELSICLVFSMPFARAGSIREFGAGGRMSDITGQLKDTAPQFLRTSLKHQARRGMEYM